jgi:hypothetical protein
MTKSNSIVRVKIIKKWLNNPNDYHYDLKLMTFEDYVNQKDFYDISIRTMEIYPYKWYNISYLYQIPAYYIRSLLFRLTNINTIRDNTLITNITESIVIISESISLIKLIITIFNL